MYIIPLSCGPGLGLGSGGPADRSSDCGAIAVPGYDAALPRADGHRAFEMIDTRTAGDLVEQLRATADKIAALQAEHQTPQLYPALDYAARHVLGRAQEAAKRKIALNEVVTIECQQAPVFRVTRDGLGLTATCDRLRLSMEDHSWAALSAGCAHLLDEMLNGVSYFGRLSQFLAEQRWRVVAGQPQKLYRVYYDVPFALEAV